MLKIQFAILTLQTVFETESLLEQSLDFGSFFRLHWMKSVNVLILSAVIGFTVSIVGYNCLLVGPPFCDLVPILSFPSSASIFVIWT